jgi:hypothetical protein
MRDVEEAFAAEALLTISACLTQFLCSHIFLRILFSGTSLTPFLLRGKLSKARNLM